MDNHSDHKQSPTSYSIIGVMLVLSLIVAIVFALASAENMAAEMIAFAIGIVAFIYFSLMAIRSLQQRDPLDY